MYITNSVYRDTTLPRTTLPRTTLPRTTLPRTTLPRIFRSRHLGIFGSTWWAVEVWAVWDYKWTKRKAKLPNCLIKESHL
ncbi:unnamed protein product [Didymodactylos carnosus]|uniref:Uncharacterized protein n=1 Tax=Didymodactylos carnosus TaxID=1234261 RepID=A0A814WAA7_9BILA|nr:unnamed protein product [Didymodactylos carnosus]CAF3963279.1 unnamed protein product [Didymodactylos carnosus]